MRVRYVVRSGRDFLPLNKGHGLLAWPKGSVRFLLVRVDDLDASGTVGGGVIFDVASTTLLPSRREVCPRPSSTELQKTGICVPFGTLRKWGWGFGILRKWG